MHADTYKDLDEQFKVFNLDGSGVIDKEDIKMVVANSKMTITEDEIENIFNEIDIEKNNVISYSEFIAVALPIEKLVCNEKLETLFSEFDENKNNLITSENLCSAFIRFGYKETT